MKIEEAKQYLAMHSLNYIKNNPLRQAIKIGIDAIEKLIPKEPMPMQNAEPEYMCICGNKMYHKPNYCDYCGQALKW